MCRGIRGKAKGLSSQPPIRDGALAPFSAHPRRRWIRVKVHSGWLVLLTRTWSMTRASVFPSRSGFPGLLGSGSCAPLGHREQNLVCHCSANENRPPFLVAGGYRMDSRLIASAWRNKKNLRDTRSRRWITGGVMIGRCDEAWMIAVVQCVNRLHCTGMRQKSQGILPPPGITLL